MVRNEKWAVLHLGGTAQTDGIFLASCSPVVSPHFRQLQKAFLILIVQYLFPAVNKGGKSL
jgi:hypothetical protein